MIKQNSLKKILYFSAFVFTLIYLTWRGLYTLPIQGSWFALIFGILLWFSEIVSNFTAMILVWSKSKTKTVQKPIVDPQDFPDIDVLIVTHNEPADLLLKTVNAACHMDYPDKNKVHIYLSDDMARAEVESLAKKFSIGYIPLTNNTEAKSGNINNALKHTSSPLVATFDADMIPYTEFLMETVPYFIENVQQRLEDEQVKPLGFVQTPQSFYNPDVFQYNLFSEDNIPNEQDFFSKEINVFNNAHDTAIYTGSNTVLSREAIAAAGGFPTDTITEDFELGALINSEGYKSISTLEPMASGLTPYDIPSVINQRIRWGRGVIQSVHNLHLLTNKKLSLPQKLIFLNSYLYWWAFSRRILYILAPILFTVFNTQVVVANFFQLVALWLPSYILVHLSMRDASNRIRTQRWGEVQETIFAPFLVLPILLQTFGIKMKTFKVTNKNATSSKRDLLYALPPAILLFLSILGIVTFNYGKFGSEIMYGSIITFWLCTNIFNLSFSVLFFLGRPIYRASERFLTEIPIQVFENQVCLLETKTYNISENGLAFSSTEPYYIKPDTVLTFYLFDKYNKRIKRQGTIARVQKLGDSWLYGVNLVEADEASYLEYLLLIYSAYNHSLPQTRDPWVTNFDRFIVNIKNRIQQAKPRAYKPSYYPAAHLAIPIQNEELEWTYFDYETLVFSSTISTTENVFHRLHVDSFTLILEFIEEEAPQRYRYRIKNIEELYQDHHFRTYIQTLIKGEQTHADVLAY
ncbi:hypothetical protein OMY_00223 [Enterococcus sulfureus ATCC 49903]|uniref:PilZ domain-containing protein n=1 Tax=Enterococcus sulfureus ATCC 49903 TaxID=1140003 RepID=S0L791_9ENTE|nr:glycosyltransferase [Enterococcus sulfureus]EOT49295.1 hypothetical protein OMY_00223 [Enterococcus sulfureus ATCC 49903]EOT87162.1 hypothetical protein I573_00218 [Enterococcus sulfureus ATCC 49903]